MQLALGQRLPTDLELAHCDLYPVNVPDGKINVSDLILLMNLLSL
jgi:hypothetical protein